MDHHYPLNVKEIVMCAQCLRTATRFVVHIGSHGQLMALCMKHAEELIHEGKE